MTHLALVGDSSIDNKAYTNGGPAVSDHVRALAPAGSKVTLCAIDGTTTSNVDRQFTSIPADATHVVLSLGGNDAILSAELLDTPVQSTGQALDLFRARARAFAEAYQHVLDQ
jgi:lysophospholipase L1-like esterase